MVRLQKFLAACGIASRRQAETLIEAGRVTVNGNVAKLGDSVPEDGADVAIDGQPVTQQEPHVYIVLNKPKGTVTSVKDTHARKTVLDCLAGVTERVFPVGRLDLDTDGVLLLTNDGELAYRLTHPKYEVKKQYEAWVQGIVTLDTARKLEQGVELEDGPTATAKASIILTQGNTTLLRLTLHEGRKREVKRMCEAVGHRVKTLRRISFAGIHATGLKPGQWRHLTPTELASLKKITKTP